MKQTAQILDYIHTHGSITPMEALNAFGCFRLASRITDLKQMGIPIVGELVTENGKRFKRYWVEKSRPVDGTTERQEGTVPAGLPS